MNNYCPKCGSSNVLVGNFLLRCLACGWHYLNKHPCRICGDESVACAGGKDEALYGCKQHPITENEMRSLVVSAFRL